MLDMPSISANVNGDSVGSGKFANPRRSDRVGFVRAARFANGRNVIDVH